MGAAYSQDLRDRVLAAADRGMRTRQIAETFAVSPAWVRRVKQRRREHGETTPRKMGGPGPRKIDDRRLAELVRERPDATLKELRQRLGVDCGETAIWYALRRLKLSFKKRRSMRRNGTARTSPNGDAAGVKPSRS